MKKILAIDDAPSIRLLVAHTIRSAGYDVVEAADGNEALRIADGVSFDMVLTDQHMPGLDGLSVIRKLREQPKHAAIPIIVLASEMGREMKFNARLAGASGWLPKPFHPETLLAIVRRELG